MTSYDTTCSKKYRLGLPEWLHEQVDSGLHKDVFWINEKEHIFQIPWKHASMNCWENKDASLFKAWAIYTNRYREGVDEPKHKQWKSNFRCAINSHNRVFFLKDQDQDKVASRRVIRIVSSAGADKQRYVSRVPKRKLYKSSRSKEKDRSYDGQDLNSVESLEKCAMLLLSLKRSSSTESSVSTSSSRNLDIDNDYGYEKSRMMMNEKEHDKDKEYSAITNIKKEATTNIDYWNKIGIKENDFEYCARNKSSASVVDEKTEKINSSFLSQSCTKNFLSKKPDEYHSAIQELMNDNHTTSTESLIHQPLGHAEISTKCPSPRQPANIPIKRSIPTTVIVTINNNFTWSCDTERKKFDENDPFDNNRITEEMNEDGYIESNGKSEDGEENDDLIMPRK